MLTRLATKTETMVHGDLRPGSIMSTPDASRQIDPEFVRYGLFGFEIGRLIANQAQRAALEARNLTLDARRIKDAVSIGDVGALCELAGEFNGKDIL